MNYHFILYIMYFIVCSVMFINFIKIKLSKCIFVLKIKNTTSKKYGCRRNYYAIWVLICDLLFLSFKNYYGHASNPSKNLAHLIHIICPSRNASDHIECASVPYNFNKRFGKFDGIHSTILLNF
jgi:hypothetical protein